MAEQHSDRRKPLCAFILGLAISFCGWADSDIDDGFDEIAEFRTEDVAMESSNDKFGAQVAVVPEYMVVGAPTLNDPVSQTGGTFLFRLSPAETPQVTFVKELDRFGDLLSVGRLGQALSGHGRTFAVAQGRDTAVNIYNRNQGGANNWGISRSIEAPDDPTYRAVIFGGSSAEYPTIDINGDLLIVGDYQGDLFNADGSAQIENRAGFAFIFERNMGGAENWGLVARLEDPSQDLDEFEEFGRATAIYDGIAEDVAVVGAPSTGLDADANVGEAYVYVRPAGSQTWTLAKTLVGEGLDGRQEGDAFGRSIDADNTTIAVGTSNGWNLTSNSGSVHLYYRDRDGPGAWGEVIEIGEGNFIDDFSKSIQLRGEKLVVGVPGGGGDSRGLVHVYQRNNGGPDNWGIEQDLMASVSEAQDEFGSGVALLGGHAIVGDRGRNSRDGGASRSGSVYVFFDDLIFCDDYEPEFLPGR